MNGPALLTWHRPGRAAAVHVRPDLHRRRRIRCPRLHPDHLQEPARGRRTRRRQIRAAQHLHRPRRPVDPQPHVLFDGKQVELGMWDDLADEFVGPDLDHAIITLRRLQKRDGQPLHLAARAPPPQNRAHRSA